MKSVTELFKESCNKDLVSSQYLIYVSTHRLAAASVVLEKDDFVEQSMTISAKAVSSNSFTIGGVCSTKFTLTLTQKGVDKLKQANCFKKGFCWRVIQWNLVDDPNQDKTNYSQNTDGSENTSGRCNLGVFYVSSIKNNDYSCDIEAYDGMLAFDRSINAKTLSYMQSNKKTIEEWVSYIVAECSKFYINLEYKIRAGLVNMDLPVSISDDVKMETFREALGYLSTLCGGFATFDELGNLILRKFDYEPTALTMSHKRLLNGKFDSEVSSITKFYSSIAGFDYEGSYSGNKGSDINSVEIYVSENPFLRGIQPYNSQEMNEQILGALSNISDSILGNDFYGCDITLSRLPYLELGDCISVERVVVDKSGVSTTVIDSNIIVCDYTYNIGSNMSIKSYTTGGTSTSSSSGSVGSEPKVKADEDGRVDELIEAFSGVKYEDRIVQIPITYDKPVITDDNVFYRTTDVIASGVSDGSAVDDKKFSQSIYAKIVEFKNPRGSIIEDGEAYNSSGTLNDAYDMNGSSESVLDYIKDKLDNIDNIRLSLSFSDARKSTGFYGLYKNTPLVVQGNEGQDTYENAGFGKFDAVKVTPSLRYDNRWNLGEHWDGKASIHCDFDDGGFSKYSIDEERPLFSGRVTCKENGSIDVETSLVSSFQASGDMYYTTPKIRTDIFIKEGSREEQYTGASGISKKYTLDEFRNAFGNGEKIQVRFGSSFVTDWGYGGGYMVGNSSCSFVGDSFGGVKGGRKSKDINEKVDSVVSAFSQFAYQLQRGGMGNFDSIGTQYVNAYYGTGYWAIVYDNLPEYATLKYRARVGIPKDINAVIEAINKGVSSNADVQALKESVEALATRQQDLTTRVTDLSTKGDTYDERIDKVTRDVTALSDELGGYDERIAKVTSDITSLSGTVKSNDERITTLTNSVDNLWATVETYDERIADATTKVDELTTLVGTYDKRITDATTKVDELDTIVGTYDSRITEAVNKVDELTTLVGTYDERITKATKDVADLSSDVTSLSSTVSSLSERLDKHIADADALFVSLDARIKALESGSTPEPDPTPEPEPEPEPPTDTLAVTDIWFESESGTRFGSEFYSDGVFYIPTADYFYVCITANKEQTVNSFLKQDSPTGEWYAFGDSTSELKSTVSDTSIEGIQQGYKVVASKDSETAESSVISCMGYRKFSASASSVVNGTSGSVEVEPYDGLPSVGLGAYKYQFWYADRSSESAKIAILKDWSTDNNLTVTIGSAEVGNLSPVYIRWYATDGYQTDTGYKKLSPN